MHIYLYCKNLSKFCLVFFSDSRCVYGVQPDPAVHIFLTGCFEEQQTIRGSFTDSLAGDEPPVSSPGKEKKKLFRYLRSLEFYEVYGAVFLIFRNITVLVRWRHLYYLIQHEVDATAQAATEIQISAQTVQSHLCCGRLPFQILSFIGSTTFIRIGQDNIVPGQQVTGRSLSCLIWAIDHRPSTKALLLFLFWTFLCLSPCVVTLAQSSISVDSLPNTTLCQRFFLDFCDGCWQMW